MRQLPSQRGRFKRVQVAAPAAGSEVAIAVPTGAIWRIISARASLVTAVAVANRYPGFALSDTGTLYLGTRTGIVQIASATVVYSWQQGGGQDRAASGFEVALSIPVDCWALSGIVVGTDTTNLQAGDQWSVMQLLVEEFIQPLVA